MRSPFDWNSLSVLGDQGGQAGRYQSSREVLVAKINACCLHVSLDTVLRVLSFLALLRIWEVGG